VLQRAVPEAARKSGIMPERKFAFAFMMNAERGVAE